MAELTAFQFEDLCREGPVQVQIGSIETVRREAMKKFLMRMGGVLAIGLVIWLALANVWGFFAFIVIAIVGGIWAGSPLSTAAAGIKQPTLEALAAQAGMQYFSTGFEPPVFGEAQRMLFGTWLSSAVFTDLFTGRDEHGRNFAFYEGTLTRGHGKHKQQVFSGTVYAFQRLRPAGAHTVIIPDKGLFNFFKPASDMQRVNFEDHPEFEKRFEVYSTDPIQAKMLLSSPATRQKLLDYRGANWGSRLFVYLGPTDALVAIQSPNRFEPGSMFKSIEGRERVRRMFDDVCHSGATAKYLKDVFG